MKKSLLFLSVLTAISLASCGNDIDTSKIALDYGYDYKNDIVNIEEVEIGYTGLTNLIDNKESFVLLIFHNRTCNCWEKFNPLAVQFMNEYNVVFHSFDNALLEGEDNYGIYRGTAAMPGICFFRRGQLIRQTIYGKLDINNREMFEDYDALEQYLFNNIYLPKMTYIDKDTLDNKIASNEDFALYVARSECNDCKTVNKEVLYHWNDTNTIVNHMMYIFDIEPYYARKPAEGDPEYDEKYAKYEAYLAFKTTYGLSEVGNEAFGYGTGYVPTFQIRKGSTITDMITVLNDSVNAEKVVSSYFTQARISNSPLLKNTGDVYLFDGKILTDEQKQNWRALQLTWHRPIVELFLNTYIK